MRRRTVRWWAFWVAVALAVPIAWLVLVADGWTVNRIVVAIWSGAVDLGFGGSPGDVDGLLNSGMLLPGAMLAALWLPWVRWWVWALLGAVCSAAVETVQIFTARDANGYDVLTNTLGATLGALAGSWINRALERRASRLVEGPVGVLGQEPGGDHRDAEHDPEQGEQHRQAGPGDDEGNQ